MQFADYAEVMRFEEAAPGNLLIGRRINGEAYFVAIRVQAHAAQRDDAPAVVVLSKTSERQVLPYYSHLRDWQAVLNLGRDWYIDVTLGDDQPLFGDKSNNAVLLRVGTTYYAQLQEANFLDFSTGNIEVEPPFLNQPYLSWDAFSIKLKVPDREEDERIYSWP